MNKFLAAFLALCMVMCMIPSVGMIICPTTESSENRALAEAPKLKTDEGALNKEFFNDFESYFTDHIALRNQMVYADAKIQTTFFHESNVSGVIYGSDDWLYYSSTLSDYLGRDVLSERELYNLAHNLSVVDQYLTDRGIAFVFTVPPNKNTLYGDYMPYHRSVKVSEDHSAKLLEPLLAEQGVDYLNLFSLFESQNEVLYLKRDSHWNMKGACMAYNATMDQLGREHETYADTQPLYEETDNGDLNKMLYSFYGELEGNYNYNLPENYVYTAGDGNVEAGWIATENPNGNGTLLMFRDSFANTWIPFFSNEFAKAYYSKGQPNGLERYVEADRPDCVVIEKVERNITDYLENPPILTAPTTALPVNMLTAQTASTASIGECMYDMNYYSISGIVDASRIATDSQILVTVGDQTYRAYQTSDNGYMLYMKKADVTGPVSVQVYVVNDNSKATQVLSTTLTPAQ